MSESPTEAHNPQVIVEIEAVEAINLSLQQNEVPTLGRITLHNQGKQPIAGLTVRVRVDPAFADPLEFRIEALGADEILNLDSQDLHLSPTYLDGVTERIMGHLTVELITDGETEIASLRKPIAVFARNEWSGVTSIPEILAAFSLPNDPAVATILKRASVIVGEKGGILNGYQEGQRPAAAAQVWAIYQAIAEHRIGYVSMTASFENTGQKIRTPTDILSHGLGNCLDMTMLLAACCEQCCLHPIVMIEQGHAYFGCWLEETGLREPSTDDRSALRKRAQLGEIIYLESTALTNASPVGTDAAQAQGEQKLHSDKPFIYAVDIKRARQSGIRPIPNIGEPPAPPRLPTGPKGTAVGGEIEIRDRLELRPTEARGAKTRLDTWKAKLLDLSLRNRLLNFKETGGAIEIITHSLSDLENALEDGKRFLLAATQDGVDDPRRPNASMVKEDSEVLKKHFDDGLLVSSKPLEEHIKRVTKLYRESRNALEESGSNTLFLAMGIIRWRPVEGGERELRAPILLVPVELRRKSLQEGYTMGAYDEETRINSSLLEMLRQHFGKELPGLDPLPEDDNGVDVKYVLDLVRDALKDMPGWEVDDTCWLGQFSFAKFLLWKDLADRSSLLTRNRVVAQLVQHPGEPFTVVESQEESLDRRMDTRPVLTTRSSDSSQLAAVMATADGGDFILEGPPGTGKSQTITNMIAHSLSQGKRVLFVAEKRAALEVVHRRLVEDGMGPFCLEIHSNKAGKLEVLKQLEATMKLGRAAGAARFEERRLELAEARDRLNSYASALHVRLPCGLSAFDCLDLLATERGLATLSVAPSQELVVMSEATLVKQRDIANRLGERLAPVAPANLHPLRNVRLTEWNPDLEAEAASRLSALRTAAEKAATAVASTAGLLGMSPTNLSRPKLEALAGLAQALLNLPGYAGPHSLVPESPALQIGWKQWETWVRARDQARQVLVDYDEALVANDTSEALAMKWRQSEKAFAPLGWLARFQIRQALRRARRDGSRPSQDEAARVVEAAAQLAKAQAALMGAQEQGLRLFGPAWKAGEVDLAALVALQHWSQAMEEALLAVFKIEPAGVTEIRRTIGNLVGRGKEGLGAGSLIGDAARSIAGALQAFTDEGERVSELLKIERQLLTGATEPLDVAKKMAETMQPALDRLRTWTSWQRIRQEAEAHGMTVAVTELEVRETPPAEGVPKLYERSLRLGIFKACLGQHPILGRFDGNEHQAAITAFRKLDEEVQKLSQEALAEAMREDVRSALADKKLAGEQAVINHEIGKKRRHISIRQLMAKAPHLIARLKPAMLMSPLSVAQFMDAALPPFDVVIFDEASQIPVWDAIGAIARGTQLIVVGDPKQLPPTSFFANSDDSEVEEEEALLTDLESILDELLRCKLAHRRLQWHYRSRHEGLITFSNRLYYESDLMTFPSNGAVGNGVQLHRVAGAVYDKGVTRTNEGEAKALIEFLVSQLSSPEGSKRSYGIVTFSQTQQRLVENLLEKARLAKPEIERHFGDTCPVRSEPVFVKNLENVQGDERDVILFSIGYGPDKDGKITMNFGPLNVMGGERRLNVAVTRAKEAVHVFTCLRPEMIDLRRTSAKGVADLRSFLEYAEKGPIALPSPSEGRRVSPPAGFVRMIEQHIQSLGYETRPQVGSSSYRVDIGVVDPANPGKFLMGIECDGSAYASAQNARDRDKLREAVLGGLGWKLHRVWSMDWWFNSKIELERLAAALEKAKGGELGNRGIGE